MGNCLTIEELFEIINEHDNRLTMGHLLAAKAEWGDRSSFEGIVSSVMRDKPVLATRILVDYARKAASIPTTEQEEFIYLRRAIAEVELLKLPSLPLTEKHLIPDDAGVYLIRSARQEVLYVGSSCEMKTRVCGSQHAAIRAIAPEVKESSRIEWYLYPHSNLCRLETYLIHKYEPILNTHSVPGLKPRSAKLSNDEIRTFCQTHSVKEVAMMAETTPAFVRVVCKRELDIFPFSFEPTIAPHIAL